MVYLKMITYQYKIKAIKYNTGSTSFKKKKNLLEKKLDNHTKKESLFLLYSLTKYRLSCYSSLDSKDLHVVIPSEALHLAIYILTLGVYNFSTRIVDNSAFNFNFNGISLLKNKEKLKNFMCLDKVVFYLLKRKNETLYIYNVLRKEKKSIHSLQRNFSSQEWLEREVSEMFGITVDQSLDTRKLLLDYGSNITPLDNNFNLLVESSQIFYCVTNQELKKIKPTNTIL